MSFKAKITKAQKKARARRAAKEGNVDQTLAKINAKLAKPHQFPVDENNGLHKTSAAIAESARYQERLMDRKRWSHAG